MISLLFLDSSIRWPVNVRRPIRINTLHRRYSLRIVHRNVTIASNTFRTWEHDRAIIMSKNCTSHKSFVIIRLIERRPTPILSNIWKMFSVKFRPKNFPRSLWPFAQEFFIYFHDFLNSITVIVWPIYLSFFRDRIRWIKKPFIIRQPNAHTHPMITFVRPLRTWNRSVKQRNSRKN